MIDTRIDVLEFMAAGDQTDIGYTDQSDLYLNLITEEVIHETLKAFDKNDIVEIADGIADSIWVIEGLAISIGVALCDIWKNIEYNRKFGENGFERDIIIENIIYSYVNLRTAYRKENPLYMGYPIEDLINNLLDLSEYYQIPLQDVWDEVSRSNFSKISDNGKVIKNEYGKIQKPVTFSPANIKKVLTDYGLLGE